MKRKTVWLSTVILAVVALLLTSCAAATPTTPAATTAPPATTAKPTTPTQPAVEEPQYGGTLTVFPYSGTQDPLSWDPCDGQSNTSWWLTPALQSLVQGDILGKGPRGTNEYSFRIYEWVPNQFVTGSLAESWELVQNPLRLIFHIRHGVYWHNKPPLNVNREFTAQDAAFVLNRRQNSPYTGWTSKPFVEAITATDKYTLEVKLKYYDAECWSFVFANGWLTNIYAPETEKAGIKDWRNMVGTGPFMVTDYVKGSSVTFTRNPNFWGKTTIKGKQYDIPFVEKMSQPIIPDESTRLAALRTAKIELVFRLDAKFKGTLETTNPELVRYQQFGCINAFIGMRTDTKPFTDIRVRRAMNLAFDHEAVMKAIYVEGLVNNWPISKLLSVYTPTEELSEQARETFQYDPVKAKQLLVEAGYPNGFKTELVTDTTPLTLDHASMLAGYWDKIGVKVELKPLESAAQSAVVYGKTFTQMAWWGKANTPPVYTLAVCAIPGNLWNTAMINDPWFTSQLQEAARIPDERMKERDALTKKLVDYFLAQHWYIVPPSYIFYTYHWPWVKNYYGELDAGYYDTSMIYAAIWIDQQTKRNMGH